MTNNKAFTAPVRILHGQAPLKNFSNKICSLTMYVPFHGADMQRSHAALNAIASMRQDSVGLISCCLSQNFHDCLLRTAIR